MRRRKRAGANHKTTNSNLRTPMILSNKFFSLAAVLTLSLGASAQGGLGGLGGLGSLGGLNGSIYNGGNQTPPTLPSVQSRFGSYDAGIGNSWLGGSVHAYAGMVRQKSGNYELGNVTAEFRGTASLLRRSAEVCEIVGSAVNIMNNGVQNRSGSFRIEVLGYPVVNANVTSNSTFAAANSVFNLIPGGVSYPIPVGPITVTLAGNAGCGFSRSANWLLPAATASVGLNASASAYAFADAHVGFGIPGFGVGVGINGHVLQQSLNASLTANAVWGLSGGVTYTLQAISIHLYAWAQAIYTWTTNLTSWSSALITRTLV
jgi:hypothetical protein